MNEDRIAGVDWRWRSEPGLARLALASESHAGDPDRAAAKQRIEIDLRDPAERLLGEYELLELIGEGGMGVVYRARQTRLERDVAIKLLSAGPWATSDFVSRFQDEARHAALLQHPAIVTIYEMGETRGLVYYAMQLVQGRSLAQLLETSGPLAPEIAALCMRPVAEAVDYAHSMGVLHLDLKPANILLDEDGSPRVADFGLARRVSADGALHRGEIAGTPGYMAPEQIDRTLGTLNARTDVWGLGATLYEALCRKAPMDRTANGPQLQPPEPLPPSHHRPLPADLEAICLKCLQRDPMRRYESARALADDLGSYLAGREVSVRPLTPLQRVLRWARREPRLAVVSGVALLALLVGLLVSGTQWRRAEGNARIAAHTAESLRAKIWAGRLDDAWTQLLARRSIEAIPGLVENLAEQESVGDVAAAERSRMRLGAVLSTSPQLIDEIAIGEKINSVALDPRANRIAVVSGAAHFRLLDVDTGAQRWFADATSTRHDSGMLLLSDLRFTANGEFLIATQMWHVGESGFVGEEASIERIEDRENPAAPIPSGEREILIRADDGELMTPPSSKFPGLVAATYSPDGAYAIVRSRVRGMDRAQLVAVAGWQPQQDYWRTTVPEDAAWLLSARAIYAACVDNRSGRLRLFRRGSSRPSLTYEHGSMLRSWAFSSDARMLALGYVDGVIELLDTATGTTHALGPGSSAVPVKLDFSEDDAWVAAAFSDGAITVWDAGQLRPVVNPFRLPTVAWSVRIDHHSRTLLAESKRSAIIWSIPARAGDPTAVVLEHSAYPSKIWAGAHAVQMDRELFVTGARDGRLQLWRLPAGTNAPGFSADVPPSGDSPIDREPGVDVAGSHATVHRAIAGASDVQLEYPDTVDLAALVPASTLLVTSAGSRIHVRDWRTGVEPHPPIELASAPWSLQIAPGGRELLTAYAATSDDRADQVVETYSIGGRRIARAVLGSGDGAISYSTDGSYVFVTRDDELQVLDSSSLTRQLAVRLGRRSTGGAEGDGPSDWSMGMMVDSGGSQVVWAVLMKGNTSLFALDARDGKVVRSWQFRATAAGLLALAGGKSALLGLREPQNKLVIVNLDGPTQALATVAPVGWPNFALGDRGRRVAVSTVAGPVIYDTASGEWLTPPMSVRPEVRFEQGTLDGRATYLRGLLDSGRWSGITLPGPVTASVDELRRYAELIHPLDASYTENMAAPLEAVQRAWLRNTNWQSGSSVQAEHRR